MDGSAPAWIVPAMRAGFTARAVVFGLIGWLALGAAWRGGYAEGAGEALKSLADEDLGRPLLWAIACGAFGFSAWAMMAAVLDVDGRGRDLRGILARVDFAGTSVVYVVIGGFIGNLAAVGISEGGFGGAGGDDEAREQGTAWLLTLPAGGWIVVAVGIGFVIVGLWFGYKGLAGVYRERLRDSPVVERLDPVCKFGWTAYGLVIVILGGFLIWAGWTLDPTRAGGFAEAFALVREAVFGRVLLGLLAIGFIAFAVECLVEAAYRIVPARHGRDAPTLATRRLAARSAASGARPRPG